MKDCIILTATEWSNNHNSLYGNKYKKDTLVWYKGNLYLCLESNNGIEPINKYFWKYLGKGWKLDQEQADWEATSGPSYIRNKPTFLGGITEESDPLFQNWLSTNPLSDYALLSSLTTKADLVLGAVPQNQSQGSTLSYDSVNGIITLVDARGDSHAIDLPIENLFQNASYNSSTQELTLTTNGGGTIDIDLATLVDLPEIVINPSSNPVSTPSTGQKMYLRADNGNYWIASSGIWVGPFLGVTTAEKANWNSKYDGSNPLDFETPAQLNIRDTNNRARANHTGTQAISTITDLQTILNNTKQNIYLSVVPTTPVTGVTTETLAATAVVALGKMKTNSILDIYYRSNRTGASALWTVTIKVNTVNNPSTATIISNYTVAGNFSPYASVYIKGQYDGVNMIFNNTNQSSGNNFASGSVVPYTVTCNNSTTPIYFFFFITPTNSSSSITIDAIEISN